jgi:hypothetical protein
MTTGVDAAVDVPTMGLVVTGMSVGREVVELLLLLLLLLLSLLLLSLGLLLHSSS